MKTLLFVLSITVCTSTLSWLTNMDTAKAEAKQSQKLIMLNFCGSDWCAPCIRMKQEIFESDTFSIYATKQLVMVKADFPRNKKNKPDAQQVIHNEALAEKYNPNGKFPFTVLLNTDGEVIREWDGLPKISPVQFVTEVEKAAKGNKN